MENKDLCLDKIYNPNCSCGDVMEYFGLIEGVECYCCPSCGDYFEIPIEDL